MKKILVPVDFSEVSANAFKYAQQFAEDKDAIVTVLHVTHPPIGDVQGVPVIDFDVFEASVKAKLEAFVKKYTLVTTLDEEDVVVESKLTVGFAGEEIIDYADDEDFDIIVLGTTGSSGIFEKIFGKVSSHVAANGPCPVLLVPPTTTYKPYEKVLFASNYSEADQIVMEEVTRIAQVFDAGIHLVHVHENKQVDYEVMYNRLEVMFTRDDETLTYHAVVLESENILTGLLKYIEEQGIDLIAMVTTHRSFVEKLFYRPFTKQMVMHTNRPLLVMHFDDVI